jgi:hypothetical protein
MLPFLFLAMQAGAARVEVTPKEFPVIVNCGMNERQVSKVTMPLYAKAILLENTREDALAMVVVDSCMMPRELLDRAKARARRRTGLREERMLISATHTHFAPAAMPCLGSREQPGYAEFLEERIAEAIARAYARRAPAQVGAAAREDGEHTFNRRFVYRRDRVMADPFGGMTAFANMHPGYQNANAVGPSGPVDAGLTLLAVRHADGRPLAVVANYSMHYFASEGISADFAGQFEADFARGMAAPEDFVAVMSQGTSGDLMWMDYGKAKRDLTLAEYTAGLVDTALAVWRGIEYRGGVVPLRMAEQQMTLERRAPTAERLEWARATLRASTGRTPKPQPEIYAQEALHLQAAPVRTLKLQALRIGDLAVTGIPNEVFAITGLKLKARSPLGLTMNIELANGAEGYIPPVEQHALGGYATWPARTAGLEVEAEPKIVEALLRLLENVTGAKRRAAVVTHGRFARAMLASKPDGFWPLDEMEGEVARASIGVDGKLTGLFAHSLEGRDGRAVLLAGGAFVPPVVEAEESTWEAWQWDALADPSWRLHAVTCAGGRATRYLDGVAVGQEADCVAARAFVLPVNFEGKLDSVAYYRRALAAVELKAHTLH